MTFDHVYHSRITQAALRVKEFVELSQSLVEQRSEDTARLDELVLPRLLQAYPWLIKQAESDDRAANLCIILAGGPSVAVWGARQSTESRLELLTTAQKAAYRLAVRHDIPILEGALGDVHCDREDYVRAIYHFEASLALHQEDPQARAQNFAGLGLANAMIGHEGDARPLLAQALEWCVTADHKPGQMTVLGYSCRAHLLWGESEAAVEAFERCLSLAHASAMGDRAAFRAGLEALCQIGRGGDAMGLAATRVRAAEMKGQDLDIAEGLLERASAQALLGYAQSAEVNLDRARVLAESYGNSAVLHDVLARLGRIRSAAGRHEEALRVLRTRLELTASWGAHRRWQALTDVAVAATAAGDTPTAIKYHQRALELAKSDGHQVVAVGEKRFEAHPAISRAAPALFHYTLYDDYALRQSRAALADLEVRSVGGAEAPSWDLLDNVVDSCLEGGFFDWSHSPRHQEQLLNLAGSTAFDLGLYERTREYQGRRAALLREHNDRRGLAHALGECADAYQREGKHAAAMQLYEEVAALDREISDHTDEVHALGNAASCAAELGDRSRALQLIRNAADLAACHDYREGRLIAQVNRGTMAFPDAPKEGFDAWVSAEALAIELDNADVLAVVRRRLADLDVPGARGSCLHFNNQGGRLASEGHVDEALESLTTAVHWSALCRDDADLRTKVLLNRGRVACRHDSVLASASFADAASHAALHGQSEHLADALRSLATVVGGDIGDQAAAVAILRRLHARQPPYNSLDALRGLIELCGFELGLGTADDAVVEDHLEEALNATLLAGLPSEEAMVLSYQGSLHERRGRLGEAEAHYRRAVHLRSHHGLGNVEEAQKNVDRVAGQRATG
ncbi:ATP-binding protein [Streptomyces bobili]|uniref:Tetratricopeptide repeat protein n=1 Tax=Streptomyces bobili TaxID=67280 RepID=A0ABZ1QQQ3_9ACTN|nr:hypothetical protein [Streptomyces bobili]